MWKKGVSILKNKFDLQKVMNVNVKVKMKVTIEFLVEIYFRNDLHFFEKYFTWGNIHPSRDFLDTLYNMMGWKYFLANIMRFELVRQFDVISIAYFSEELYSGKHILMILFYKIPQLGASVNITILRYVGFLFFNIRKGHLTDFEVFFVSLLLIMKLFNSRNYCKITVSIRIK